MGNWMDEAEPAPAPKKAKGSWMDEAEPAPKKGSWMEEAEPVIPVSKEPGDLAAQAPPPDEGTSLDSKLTSVGRAMEKAGTAGFADEAVAGVGAIPVVGRFLNTSVGNALQGKWHPESTYKENLAESRADFAKSHKDNPGLSTATELATALALPGPGKAKAATTLGRVAKAIAANAGMGALYGLGNSNASLLDGQVGQAAKDTGISALISGGLGAVGEAAGGLKSLFGNKVLNATADAGRTAAQSAMKAVRRDSGALGGDAGAVLNTWEKAKQILADEGAPQEAKQWAAEHLADPAMRETVNRAYRNIADGAPRLLGKMRSSEAALETSQKAATPEAVDAAATLATSPMTALKKAGRFAWNYGSRLGPTLLGATLGVGHGATGVLGGGAAGTVLGGVLGAVMGHPGTAMKNLLQDPATRKLLFTALEHSLGTAPEAVLSKYTGLAPAVGGRAVAELSEEEPPIVTPAHYGSHP